MAETLLKPELFFGLVGAAGTDLEKVGSVLAKALHTADYSTETIRLSSQLRAIDKFKGLPTKDYFDYVDSHMTAGDDFRRETGRADAVALLSVGKIMEVG